VFGAATDIDVAENTIINERADQLHRHLQTGGNIFDREQSIGRPVGEGGAPGLLVRALPPHACQLGIRPRRHHGPGDKAQV